jgi:hypothetical protein
MRSKLQWITMRRLASVVREGEWRLGRAGTTMCIRLMRPTFGESKAEYVARIERLQATFGGDVVGEWQRKFGESGSHLLDRVESECRHTQPGQVVLLRLIAKA